MNSQSSYNDETIVLARSVSRALKMSSAALQNMSRALKMIETALEEFVERRTKRLAIQKEIQAAYSTAFKQS